MGETWLVILNEMQQDSQDKEVHQRATDDTPTEYPASPVSNTLNKTTAIPNLSTRDANTETTQSVQVEQPSGNGADMVSPIDSSVQPLPILT
jgi:hypothetical protein